MVWVTWRQHRGALIGVPGVLGAIAVFLLVMGLKIHHDYAVLVACSHACGHLNHQFNATDWTVGNTVNVFTNLAPALIGGFAGAPILSRELESGTYRYAWTQGFGRTRWTIAKLALVAISLAVVAGAFAQLQAWFFQPFLKQEDLTVMSSAVFDSSPIVYAAWTLAAIAVGALIGMVTRRIVPAIAGTFAVYAGIRVATWVLVQTNNKPASWYWPLQLIEVGCLLLISVLLVAATVRLVQRRAA